MSSRVCEPAGKVTHGPQVAGAPTTVPGGASTASDSRSSTSTSIPSRVGRWLDAHDEVERALAEAVEQRRRRRDPHSVSSTAVWSRRNAAIAAGAVHDGGDVDHPETHPTLAGVAYVLGTSSRGRGRSASIRRAWSSTGRVERRSTRRRPCASNSCMLTRPSSSANPCESAEGLTPTRCAASAHVVSSATATRYSSWRMVRSGSGGRTRRRIVQSCFTDVTGRPAMLQDEAMATPPTPTIAPADGKLGVLIVGLGAVSSTLIAGVELAKLGLAEPFGSLTQMATIRLGRRTDANSPLIKDFVPLVARRHRVRRMGPVPGRRLRRRERGACSSRASTSR